MVDHSGHHLPRGHDPFLKLRTNSYLVVPQWSTESIYGLTGAMLAGVAASVTYECLNEYLLHLKRNAIRRKNRSECCGVPVITCQEKVGQTVIQVMRVLFGYFMMLCVMTMNIWLLISVVIGAAVGYGVGKPIVANGIHDAVTSHGYDSAIVRISRRANRRSEVSRSWRYQAISGSQFGKPEVCSKQSTQEVDESVCSPGNDIIWLRRSSENIAPDIPPDLNKNEDVQVRTHGDPVSASTSNVDSINSRESGSSFSRFRSTSKIINESFRSHKSDSESIKHLSNASVFSQESPQIRYHRNASRTPSKVSRTSSVSSGRFKSVSRQINKEMSINSDFE